MRIKCIASRCIHILNQLVRQIKCFPVIVMIQVDTSQQCTSRILIHTSVIFLFGHQCNRLFQRFYNKIISLSNSRTGRILIGSHQMVYQRSTQWRTIIFRIRISKATSQIKLAKRNHRHRLAFQSIQLLFIPAFNFSFGNSIQNIPCLTKNIKRSSPQWTGIQTIRTMIEHIACIAYSTFLRTLHIIPLHISIGKHSSPIISGTRHQIIQSIHRIIHIGYCTESYSSRNLIARSCIEEITTTGNK